MDNTLGTQFDIYMENLMRRWIFHEEEKDNDMDFEFVSDYLFLVWKYPVNLPFIFFVIQLGYTYCI